MQKATEPVEKVEIHTGIHIMRRKQTNVVTNEDGEPLWTGASIFKACRFCMDNGHYSVTLHCDSEHIRVMLAEPIR